VRVAGQGKLPLHVLSSLNEFPIRSGPYAGLEIASLQFSYLSRGRLMSIHSTPPALKPAGNADAG